MLSWMPPRIENTNHIVTEMRVLEVSLENSLSSDIVPGGLNFCFLCDPLHTPKLGLVLADLGCISFASMASLPSIATSGSEAGRLLARVCLILCKLLLELLTERNKEACGGSIGDGLTGTFGSPALVSSLALSISYFTHLLHKIWLLFFS